MNRKLMSEDREQVALELTRLAAQCRSISSADFVDVLKRAVEAFPGGEPELRGFVRHHCGSWDEFQSWLDGRNVPAGGTRGAILRWLCEEFDSPSETE